MRLNPSTKCSKCGQNTECYETLKGFICADCYLHWVECRKCGVVIYDKYMITLATGDKACPVCFARNSFRLQEAF